MPTIETREWGVLLKVQVKSDGLAPDPSQLDLLLAALPGTDKKLTGGGADFTVAWWVEASDAASATKIAGDTVRRIARSQGFPPLTFVRSHTASVEGRAPTSVEAESELDTLNEWALDFKVSAPASADLATPELLDRVHAAIDRPDLAVTFRGDQEKFLLDDGSGFTVSFSAGGGPPAGVFGAARQDLLDAIDQLGLDGWRLVRFKAFSRPHKQNDTFPGAGTRVPLITEETR